jgi:hypothetical protein
MKREGKRSLVVQHLERIAGAALDEFPEALRDFIRGRNGVYSLYKGDRLYYVGLARNLRSRLRGHMRDRHAGRWDRFSIYITEGDEHLKELESLILRIVVPAGNRVKGKFMASEDLRKKFRHGLQASMSSKLDEMAGLFRPAQARPVPRKAKPKTADAGNAALAALVTRRFHIRLHYRDKQYVAHVRTDGTIAFAPESAEADRLKGKVFPSPSAAATAVTGHSMNGWATWHFWSTAGDLVPLDALRKGRAKPRF